MGSQHKRLFIAIPISQEISQALQSCTPKYDQALKKQKPPVKKLRWMPPVQWHITLFFLGKTGSAVLPLLQRKLKNLFSESIAFKLRFKSVCYAPPKGKKRMIWAQFDTPSDYAQLVYHIYETLEQDFGLQPPRKKPIPHITLARFKKVHREELPDLVQPSVTKKLKVDHCELWESELASKGPTYRSLGYYNFGSG